MFAHAPGTIGTSHAYKSLSTPCIEPQSHSRLANRVASVTQLELLQASTSVVPSCRLLQSGCPCGVSISCRADLCCMDSYLIVPRRLSGLDQQSSCLVLYWGVHCLSSQSAPASEPLPLLLAHMLVP
eukprot:917635-Amphidinium_carterae.3